MAAAVDMVVPFASVADLNNTAYADLIINLQPGEVDRIMVQATRACENACGRRLAPFTTTETKRMDAGDIEDGAFGSTLLSGQQQMNLDRAAAMGINQLASHVWVDEYPPVQREFWTGAVTAVSLNWGYQTSPVTIGPGQIQYEVDTGHIRFLVGTFVPFGATARITYTGGYSTVPADLQAACLAMAASIVIKRLDPSLGSQHDPDLLRDEAVEMLLPYMRD